MLSAGSPGMTLRAQGVFKLTLICYILSVVMGKIIPVKPLLLHLYGFPGSGKTYFARQFCEHFQAAHVQDDRIRFELFEEPRYDKQENDVIAQLMDYMTTEFLNAGISVVYDTNAYRLSQRHGIREMARKAHAQAMLAWLQIDTDSAFQRISQRDRRRSDDKYAAPIDDATFSAIASRMQNPQPAEDYVVISGKHAFKTQMSTVVRRMHELGILKSDDTLSGVVKPGLVNLVPQTVQHPTPGGRVDLARRNIMIR
jgi:predicted kinase